MACEDFTNAHVPVASAPSVPFVVAEERVTASAPLRRATASYSAVEPIAHASAPAYPALDPPARLDDVRSTVTYSEQASSHASSSSDYPSFASNSGPNEFQDGEIYLDVPLSDAIEVRTAASWWYWQQRYEIIIAHPDSRINRGLVLTDLGSCTRSDAEVVLRRIQGQLAEQIDGNRISPSMYQNLIDQPKLRLAYTETIPAPVSAAPAAVSAAEASSSTAPSTSTAESPSDGCPICMENINPADAVLRCQSAPCHYFHQRCLRSWIQQCQRGNATCPMCRQGLDIHGGRLNDFLNGTASANLSEDERTFLQTLLSKIPDREEWADLVTVENAQYVGGILMSFGYGFFCGYNSFYGGGLSGGHRSRHVQVAEGIGFVAGTIIRAAKTYKHHQQEDNRDGRKRRR